MLLLKSQNNKSYRILMTWMKYSIVWLLFEWWKGFSDKKIVEFHNGKFFISVFGKPDNLTSSFTSNIFFLTPFFSCSVSLPFFIGVLFCSIVVRDVVWVVYFLMIWICMTKKCFFPLLLVISERESLPIHNSHLVCWYAGISFLL